MHFDDRSVPEHVRIFLAPVSLNKSYRQPCLPDTEFPRRFTFTLLLSKIVLAPDKNGLLLVSWDELVLAANPSSKSHQKPLDGMEWCSPIDSGLGRQGRTMEESY